MVMALSLLSLVFLLVISLINLVGTDLSLSEVRKERILTKAHARVGMMVAIGEIQKHLGPDTRVTATADILTRESSQVHSMLPARNTMRKVLYLVSMMVRTEIKLLIWMKMVIWTKSLWSKALDGRLETPCEKSKHGLN